MGTTQFKALHLLGLWHFANTPRKTSATQFKALYLLGLWHFANTPIKKSTHYEKIGTTQFKTLYLLGLLHFANTPQIIGATHQTNTVQSLVFTGIVALRQHTHNNDI